MAEPRRAPHYTAPDQSLQRFGVHGCVHCGCGPGLHHPTGRCYSVAEMAARVRFWQQHGRWPEDDADNPVASDE